MLDTAATYRSTQVVTTTPTGRVVLLYQGAIRFANRHVAALEAGDQPAAHDASMRCQQIVSALQETLDLSAGPIAGRLDAIYRFMLDRLMAGNLARDPQPTRDVLTLLRNLSEAWSAIGGTAPAATAGESAAPPAPAGPAAPAAIQPRLVGYR